MVGGGSLEQSSPTTVLWAEGSVGGGEGVDGDGEVGAVSVAVDSEAAGCCGDGFVAEGVELVGDVVAVGGVAVGVGRGGVDGAGGGQDGVVGEDGPVAAFEVVGGEVPAVVAPVTGRSPSPCRMPHRPLSLAALGCIRYAEYFKQQFSALMGC